MRAGADPAKAISDTDEVDEDLVLEDRPDDAEVEAVDTTEVARGGRLGYQ